MGSNLGYNNRSWYLHDVLLFQNPAIKIGIVWLCIDYIAISQL